MALPYWMDENNQLSNPLHKEADFTAKWVVVLHLQDTVGRFFTGMKFLLWYYTATSMNLCHYGSFVYASFQWHCVQEYRAITGNQANAWHWEYTVANKKSQMDWRVTLVGIRELKEKKCTRNPSTSVFWQIAFEENWLINFHHTLG